jgi:poly-gamma-glutamate capsule biosynthesis protein CapA/YwtB (metallophosphatase superfamily)
VNFLKSTSDTIILTFAGDFLPNNNTLKFVREGKINEFAPELSNILKESDFSIVNLETPLTTKKNPIEKTGNNLMAHPDNANLIKNIGFDAVTLANNHILDQNEQGVLDTLNACKKAGLKTVGAAENLENAKVPLIVDIKNKKIGLINLCEQEFNIATETTAGANPFTAINAYYQIKENRLKFDYIIVIFHGGLEYHHIPLPGFIENCRFMIDCGADAVICHHTHYISGYEYYKEKPIFYGLGNFYCKYKSKGLLKNKELHKGLMVKLKFIKNKKLKYDFFEVQKSDNQEKIYLKNSKENFKYIASNIYKYNEIINTKKTLDKYWRKHYKKYKLKYYTLIKFSNPIFGKIFKKLGLSYAIKSSYLKRIANIIKCDAHREITIKVFEE